MLCNQNNDCSGQQDWLRPVFTCGTQVLKESFQNQFWNFVSRKMGLLLSCNVNVLNYPAIYLHSLFEVNLLFALQIKYIFVYCKTVKSLFQLLHLIYRNLVPVHVTNYANYASPFAEWVGWRRSQRSCKRSLVILQEQGSIQGSIGYWFCRIPSFGIHLYPEHFQFVIINKRFEDDGGVPTYIYCI